MPERRRLLLLAAAALSAGAVYTFGARSGATQPFYVDETYYDVYAFQLAQAVTGRGVPTFVVVFPSAFSLLLAGIYALMYAVGRLMGEFGSVGDFLVRFAVDRAPFVIAARYLSAAF